MTYEEARDVLKSYYNPTTKSEIRIAIECIEMQIPKGELCDMSQGWSCPNCGHLTGRAFAWCPDCGQHLK